ncbi:MAG: fructose-6-phosphate aldolase [Bdellovibrionales bacterium CG10_big_fil_rev_8_21_14_0_10_45_34]|nr:MAG: fructose-6-phosphate aldolase [Bdellovibrionales bacterium CG10_big_fil_rev_8_21_14_0_10_45_34]
MKLFIDSADIEEIKIANERGWVDGVTTNPSLIAKTGRDHLEVLKDICREVKGPISAEVVGLQADIMYREGKELAKIHDNIVVKIPMTEEGLVAVKRFSSEGISTNVTLVFSPLQAMLAAKAGASMVSPFVGRLDDVGAVGMELIQQIVTIFRNYDFKTEVLVASIRNPVHVLEAAMMGADISTLPLKVMQQLTKHPLTDKGIETFLADWEKSQKK